MQGLRSPYLWVGIALCILIVWALIFWLRPPSDSPTNAILSTNSVNQSPHSSESAVLSSQQSSISSPSQSNTQVNCQIKLDQQNNLVVNEQTKDCFEYFLTQYGEKNLVQIENDFKQYSAQHFKDPALSALNDLWERYLKYRRELGEQKEPSISKNDISYYQQVFASRQMLRQQFFSSVEIEGLFGDEDLYDQYTLERMTILNNNNLSESEKAKKLRDLFDQLPEQWKANLEQLTKLDDLRQLTAAIREKGGSAQDLHEMRTNLVGYDAAQRLETLDAERLNWKNDVTQYLEVRQSILNSSMSDSAKQDAIVKLKNNTFSNPQAKIRIQAFESAKDQGLRLPFSE